MAVYPSAPEALPALERALAGPGRPDGVTDVRRDDAAVVVTWDPSRSAVRLVMAVIDAELRRYNATRRTEVRGELSLEQLTQIAAQELMTPEIAPDRVLEALLAQAGFGEISC
jgi:hypothetical protein